MPSADSTDIRALPFTLRDGSDNAAERFARQSATIETASPRQLAALLPELAALADGHRAAGAKEDAAAFGRIVARVSLLARRIRSRAMALAATTADWLDEGAMEALARLAVWSHALTRLRYPADEAKVRNGKTGTASAGSPRDPFSTLASQATADWLATLAVAGNDAALAHWAEGMVMAPPPDPDHLAMAAAPLFRRRDFSPTAVFPRLFDALDHPAAAAVTLDLANYVTRSGMVEAHPATDRSRSLTELLAAVTRRLEQLQRAPPEEAAHRQVMDGVTLAVSLCDALALIGDDAATATLRGVLSLTHRRLRVEAAAALAKLADKEGPAALAELAAEPVIRLRAIHYAQELGLLDEIPAECRTDLARAEGALAARLAEPTCFGFPPQGIELVSRRTLMWPGFDEAVECFLLKYTYELPGGSFQNLGIAGPLTHATAADLTQLSEQDTLALFAGFSTEHEAVQLFEPEEAPASFQKEVQRVLADLAAAGLENPRPALIGRFFERVVVVAETAEEGQTGVVAADYTQRRFWPKTSDRPLSSHEAWWIHIGRELLAAFNEGFSQ